MTGTIVFFLRGGGEGGRMHRWECEGVVTRIKSFTCCEETTLLLLQSS